MLHLSIFGRINLRHTAAVVFVGLMLIAALAANANAEGGITRGNVTMYYGYNGALHRVTSTTTVYTGSTWKPSSRSGHLVATKHGIALELTKRENLVGALVYYGTIATPTWANIAWNGRGTVPYTKQLKAADGKTYTIALSSVFVMVHQAGRPLPPQTVGDK